MKSKSDFIAASLIAFAIVVPFAPGAAYADSLLTGVITSAAGEKMGGVTVVVGALDGWDAGGLKVLAMALVDRPSHAVALFTKDAPFLVVVARSTGVPIDSAAALKSLIAKFGGKGGGHADMAQGGGLQGAPTAMADAARSALGSALSS